MASCIKDSEVLEEVCFEVKPLDIIDNLKNCKAVLSLLKRDIRKVFVSLCYMFQ